MSAELTCIRCGGEMDPADRFCRRCGEPAGTDIRWWESPWFILPMLFVVLGPLALPLLWRSRCFGPVWKWLLTVFVVATTVVVVWRMWIAVGQMAAQFRVLQQQLQ